MSFQSESTELLKEIVFVCVCESERERERERERKQMDYYAHKENLDECMRKR